MLVLTERTDVGCWFHPVQRITEEESGRCLDASRRPDTKTSRSEVFSVRKSRRVVENKNTVSERGSQDVSGERDEIKTG